MKITVKRVTNWNRVLNAARKTVGKKAIEIEPSDKFKNSILKAEHSPIRLLEYDIDFEEIPSYIVQHLVRHHEGCEKFVLSKRPDRGGGDPNKVTRLTPVNMSMTCNAQALINISRKRLCNRSSKGTRDAWNEVKNQIKYIDPFMSKYMVRECIYRGFCPEMECCGYVNTEEFNKKRKEYVN